MEVNKLNIEFTAQFYEPELIEEIKNVGAIKQANVGETLIEIGQYIKFIPVILKGSIKILRENEEGDELFMYYISSGDTCSMSLTCCMQNRISGIRAVVEEDVEYLAIPINYIEDWIRKYASWRSFIFRSYQTRLDEMLSTIDSLAFKKMDERLWDYLIQKSINSGSKTILTTHQEIATDLHASREAVSRLLKRMEQDGVILLGRNKIEILEE